MIVGAIKTSVPWLSPPNPPGQPQADPELKRLSDERMDNIDERYGTATGMFCADESLCAAPWDTREEARKSPSRGTELCAVVESMYSYNEMFSILGAVRHADRAEKIALNALSATWASPRGGDMWQPRVLKTRRAPRFCQYVYVK